MGCGRAMGVAGLASAGGDCRVSEMTAANGDIREVVVRMGRCQTASWAARARDEW